MENTEVNNRVNQTNQVEKNVIPTVTLDIRTIVEQLGVDLTNWPSELPALTSTEKNT